MARKWVYFACAGKFKDGEKVWLSSKQRKYSPKWSIFHRNEYETVIEMPHDIYNELFNYDQTYGSYTANGMTWGELRNYPGVIVREDYLGE